MATLTIKSIPTELYDRLKASAASHRRSLNSEILVCLERALLSERLDPAAQLARADALRERAALTPVTDALLGEARRRMARTDEHPIPAGQPEGDRADGGDAS